MNCMRQGAEKNSFQLAYDERHSAKELFYDDCRYRCFMMIVIIVVL